VEREVKLLQEKLAAALKALFRSFFEGEKIFIQFAGRARKTGRVILRPVGTSANDF
jgi:hypothetical protein